MLAGSGVPVGWPLSSPEVVQVCANLVLGTCWFLPTPYWDSTPDVVVLGINFLAERQSSGELAGQVRAQKNQPEKYPRSGREHITIGTCSNSQQYLGHECLTLSLLKVAGFYWDERTWSKSGKKRCPVSGRTV